MSSTRTFQHDPGAALDYTFDWSTWLTAEADTLSSYTVTVPSGLTLDSDSETSGAVTAWISGGTAGTSYTVTCEIVTTGARTDQRSIILVCRDR